MAAEIQSAGGILTMADLVDAQPVIKQPLRAQVSHASAQQLSTLLHAAAALSFGTKMGCRSLCSCYCWCGRMHVHAAVTAGVHVQMWGLEVLAVPPPSSGACVVAALQFLAGATHARLT